MMAANLGVSNLVVLVDCNDFGGLERMSAAHPAFHPLYPKFEAFGWKVDSVDGHQTSLIVEACRVGYAGDRPIVGVCQTVKGRGVSFMENDPIWHYRSPSPEEYRRALEELV
jgi:transketolase